MPANANQIGTEQINFSLDQEFLGRFNQEHDRLAEIIGLVTVETVAAGHALYQLKVKGKLEDGVTPASYTAASGDDPAVIELGSSSGEDYIEGDLVSLSRFEVEKVPLGDVEAIPYRKQTTAKAIQQSGFVPAVLKTDAKMVTLARAKVLDRFFRSLANGIGEIDEGASPATLQAALSYADAAISVAMEENGDETSMVLHFVNSVDIAGYLANAQVTTQTVYGMKYIESFLGIDHIFVTSKVPKGKVYATPAENLRVFGIDFGALAQAGLPYETQANGLIGVHHEGGYDRVSAYTNVLVGATMFAEVLDYIVIAEFSGGEGGSAPAAAPDATLASLSLGAAELSPSFSKDVTAYTASTTSTTNTVTAVATDAENADIAIAVGETPVTNGQAATWEAGENTLTVTVTNGNATKTYTVTVTKS